MPHNKITRLDRLTDDLESLSHNLKDPTWSTVAAIATFLRPRQRAAWAVNNLGLNILALSARMHDACPSSFDEFWEDGRDEGRREVVRLWVTRQTDMETIGQLIIGLGMDTDDVIGHLGLRSEVTQD